MIDSAKIVNSEQITTAMASRMSGCTGVIDSAKIVNSEQITTFGGTVPLQSLV